MCSLSTKGIRTTITALIYTVFVKRVEHLCRCSEHYCIRNDVIHNLNCQLPKSELFDIVEQTPAPFFSIAGLLPK